MIPKVDFGFPKKDQPEITKEALMSSMSEEADPSESRAAARNALRPYQSRVTSIVRTQSYSELYGRIRMASRDLCHDFSGIAPGFSVFRRASNTHLSHRKRIRGRAQAGIYSVIRRAG